MATDPPPDVALNLALAVVSSSTAPLLLLDGRATVVAASASFCKAFQIDPAAIVGRILYAIGDGEWDSPRLRSLLDSTLAGAEEIEAYEIDLTSRDHGIRRLVLNAHILSYDKSDVRLLLTVSDVTDARIAARIKDDLVRDKAILLQEVQHRVANSLQIIASVLMQSAKKVQSEETRGHLHDAHNRVMSIAAVQSQLAQSRQGDVALRPYFTRLCASIGASMIADSNRLSIAVTGDDSSVNADISVSLGLIVTELVINALKHAFPDDRHGKIAVDYRADGSAWTLSIRDDGVGMPATPSATPGLGTSIVEALARQLKARIDVTEIHPGTSVAVIHAAAAVGGNDNPEPANVAV